MIRGSWAIVHMFFRLSKEENKKLSSKKTIFNASILAGAVFLSGINQGVQAKTRPIIAVEPLTCDLVKAIALPSQSVNCLIDRKKDVHDVKISPRQAKILKNASQVFTLGQEMTPAMKKWLDNPITVVVGVSEIEIDDVHDDHLAAKHDDHDDHDHHDHGGLDPHIWHDPHNIIKMANVISKNIEKNISFFDRANRKVLSERSKFVNSLLEDLDQWTQEQVATIPSNQRTIVSTHKAMEYYGDAFGLKTISLLDVLGHSSSLRPQTISTVLEELREENVKVLFAEQTPSSKLLKNLSRQTSTPIASQQIYVDGLMPTGNTISVAVHNTCTIVNSLGGLCNKKVGKQLEERWYSLTKR